jgi:RNA polymerase sigma-70 factor (ECF subfamily)
MDGVILLRKDTSMPPDVASPDVVALAQRGDGEALGALYDGHYRPVFHYFWSRLGDRHLAEDLAGEVFRRMLTGLPRFQSVGGLPFRAWLFRIAHNLLIDHYRRAAGRPVVPLDETVQHRAADSPDPASLVEQKLQMEHAYRALAEIEPAQRDVLALRFLSGLSLRDTALAVGKTEDAVKALQRRGLLALRLALTPDE